MNGKRKRYALILGSILVLTAVVGTLTYLPVHGEEEIYESVIRVHVLAHSDSEEDQAVKMKVRDRVLSVTQELMAECKDREQARRLLEHMLPMLTKEAQACLEELQSDQTVELTLTNEHYPTRAYESFCFPAGSYLSLQVKIGKAEGQNFWCVLFPPLCMSAATVGREQAEEEFIAVGLTKDQYAIITQTQNGKYKLRFRILELLRSTRK